VHQGLAYGGDAGTVDGTPVALGEPVIAFTGRAVDWNRNNVIDSGTVVADIENIDIAGCGNNPFLIRGWADWANINFDFRGSSTFATGSEESEEPAQGEFYSAAAQKLIDITVIPTIAAISPSTTCSTFMETQVLLARAEFDDDTKDFGDQRDAAFAILTTLKADILAEVNGCDPSDPKVIIVLEQIDFLLGFLETETEVDITLSRTRIRQDNKNGRGLYQLTVFGTPEFDVSKVLVESLFFGEPGNEEDGAPPHHPTFGKKFFDRHFKDVDADGILDIKLHFQGKKMNFCTLGVQEGSLVGKIERETAELPFGAEIGIRVFSLPKQGCT